MMKEFKSVVTVNDKRCHVAHTSSGDFSQIPLEKVTKTHAVCMHNGLLLIVNHPEWNIWGIPGGTREGSESPEDTLAREILEESNCEVISSTPLSYQRVYHSSGIEEFRLFYLCEVNPAGEFIEDPAGNINKIEWIEPTRFMNFIEKKEFKQIVLKDALERINNSENRTYQRKN